MSNDELIKTYKYRYDTVLCPLATKLEDHIRDIVIYSRIDRICARAKSPGSFIEKAEKLENGKKKYHDPLNQIHDQIGARIVAHYLCDVEPLCEIVNSYFAPIEEKLIFPDSEKEFDYEGMHYILFLPKDLITPELPKEHCPTFFELQIKTLFQHAWAEADHNLAYKPIEELSKDQKRRVAFAAAQAWGADHFFNLLFGELLDS